MIGYGGKILFMDYLLLTVLIKIYTMAALENNSRRTRSEKKVKFTKNSTKVDLTPMVDLGFLLITFFVFTTTMSKPTVMKVEMPYDKDGPDDKICNSCVLTAVLCKNDSILYYEGNMIESVPGWSSFEDFRKIIQAKKTKVEQLKGANNQFVLIIKPAENSLFKNFVDITDEVTINAVKRYYIDDLTTTERDFLKLD